VRWPSRASRLWNAFYFSPEFLKQQMIHKVDILFRVLAPSVVGSSLPARGEGWEILLNDCSNGSLEFVLTNRPYSRTEKPTLSVCGTKFVHSWVILHQNLKNGNVLFVSHIEFAFPICVLPNHPTWNAGIWAMVWPTPWVHQHAEQRPTLGEGRHSIVLSYNWQEATERVWNVRDGQGIYKASIHALS
jgi:hypothetical protein